MLSITKKNKRISSTNIKLQQLKDATVELNDVQFNADKMTASDYRSCND